MSIEQLLADYEAARKVCPFCGVSDENPRSHVHGASVPKTPVQEEGQVPEGP